MADKIIRKGKSLRELKKIISHLGQSYRHAQIRLEMMNYDNKYFTASKQTQHDIEFIAYMNHSLAMCSRENSQFLFNTYIYPDTGKNYYANLSRSSLYRLNKRAIIEIADCLNL